LDGRVIQDLVLASGDIYGAIALLKSGEGFGAGRVYGDQLTTRAADRIRDAVYMVVVQPDDRKTDRVLRGLVFRVGGNFMRRLCTALKGKDAFRHCAHDAGGSRCRQKGAPRYIVDRHAGSLSRHRERW